jgi:hypothetical protein
MAQVFYMARTMLSRYDTVPYTGYHTCELTTAPPSYRLAAPEEDLDEDKDEGQFFNLYPNPNTGQFNVVVSVNDEEKAEILIWTISGKLVRRTKLISGVNDLVLNEADGLYLYVVTVNDVLKWSGKVSVTTY